MLVLFFMLRSENFRKKICKLYKTGFFANVASIKDTIRQVKYIIYCQSLCWYSRAGFSFVRPTIPDLSPATWQRVDNYKKINIIKLSFLSFNQCDRCQSVVASLGYIAEADSCTNLHINFNWTTTEVSHSGYDNEVHSLLKLKLKLKAKLKWKMSNSNREIQMKSSWISHSAVGPATVSLEVVMNTN